MTTPAWTHKYRSRTHRPEQAARRFIRDHWGGDRELVDLVEIGLEGGGYRGLFRVKGSGPARELSGVVVWLLATTDTDSGRCGRRGHGDRQSHRVR